jgi:hypothetical protein
MTRMAGDHFTESGSFYSRCEAPPPPAHPPEGSREPQKWPCQVAKGTKCSSEMCEPPTPPPGPGQDVEAQAQNEQLWRETRAWMAAPCPHPDTLGASQSECWHCVAALRAALAEVDEAQLGVEGRCPVGHNKRFTFELLGRIGCVACERDAAERRAQEKEEELIILREKLAEHTNCVKRDSSGFCCGASRDRNANILMHLEINRRRNR